MCLCATDKLCASGDWAIMTETLPKSPHTLDPAASHHDVFQSSCLSYPLQWMTEVEKVEREKHAEQKAGNLELSLIHYHKFANKFSWNMFV